MLGCQTGLVCREKTPKQIDQLLSQTSLALLLYWVYLQANYNSCIVMCFSRIQNVMCGVLVWIILWMSLSSVGVAEDVECWSG